MYAKLVSPNGVSDGTLFMRDIVRLLTSNNPSTANLEAFSNTLSIIVDSTPAGWSYIGSNVPGEVPNLSQPFAGINNGGLSNTNFIISAPCASVPVNKYAAFTMGSQYSLTPYISTSIGQTGYSNGQMLNESGRVYTTSTITANVINVSIDLTNPGTTLHVVSNPRHVTIVVEGKGIHGIWESSATEAHIYYNTAPYVQYEQADSTTTTYTAYLNPNNYFTASVLAATNWGTVVNHYSPFNNTYNPTYSVHPRNSGNFYQLFGPGYRLKTVSNTGIGKAMVTPIWYALTELGYPPQLVTGVTPIYYTNPFIGNSGDPLVINGVTYTYFNAGSGFGVAMLTN